MTPVYSARPTSVWDRVGIVVSSICLVHCLVVPFVIILLPAFLHDIPESEWIHIVLAIVAIPVAFMALTRGYKRHRSIQPCSLALPGISLLCLSLLLHEPHWLETVVASIGALLLASGHIQNHRLLCRCDKVD
ncbi:MAG: MerC domain-containing protein [Kordiimonas sp.]